MRCCSCLNDVREGVNGTSHKKWTELAACLGALSFCISDTCLAINRFHSDVPHQRWIVMTTYYLAQLGIALSVVKNRHIKRRRLLKKRLESKNSNISNVVESCLELKCD